MVNSYPEWNRLEELLASVNGRGIDQLPAGEILEFGRHYRRASAELAFHRTHEADPQQLAYLNDLVGRCYPHVYVAPRRPLPGVLRFFTVEFPRAFRRHGLLILIAFLISMLPAVIGFTISWHNRPLADQVLPADLLVSSEGVAERHHVRRDWLPSQERAYASSMIMTNNIKVSILAFAGGMTAGILTLLLMIYNGLMLGIAAAIVGRDGLSTAVNFWAFVAPHGVIELTAIFIAGGAGLVLAYAMINPGEYPRRVALREAGKEAVKLMLGVASLLVVAGLIEGFFSPMNIPEVIKFTVAGVEAVLFAAYLLFAGRRAADEPETPFGHLMTPLPPV